VEADLRDAAAADGAVAAIAKRFGVRMPAVIEEVRDDGRTVLAFGVIRPYKGLGDAIEAVRRAEGARLLVAETSSRDVYAQTRDFYARGGYVERARVRGFYAVDDDRVIFSKQLAVSAGEETP